VTPPWQHYSEPGMLGLYSKVLAHQVAISDAPREVTGR
jgi:hypothetical protein